MPNADWELLLERLSAMSTTVIVAAFAVHVFGMFILYIWAKRDLRNIASCLLISPAG